MKILKIYSMRWADSAKKSVTLIADIEEGNPVITSNNVQISTPYDQTSIIWQDVAAFPVASIAEYVAPVIQPDSDVIDM